ncbi:MAG TPA: TPM domain-containing protein [Ramlibacter sp.]|nr:TPM domain-containing protein [Ramlibacter sp.]
MRFLLCLLCALLAPWAQAQDLLPVPTLTAHVIDQTGTLDAIERQGIEDRLAALEKDKGAQVAFLIVATTQPEDIASYANRVANAWRIGRKGVGDGLLLVVAKDDRKIRIEVAKTLEGAIPDLRAKQIIDEAITPAFRNNDFAGGLRAAGERIAALVAGEALPAPARPAERKGGVLAGFDWFDLAIFLFLAVPVGAAVLRGIFGRKLGALFTSAGVGTLALLATSSLLLAGVAAFLALLFVLFFAGAGTGRRGGGVPWIGSGSSGNSWGGGGGGSSSSDGGGFSSGGGGDFGGGGASGDW